MVAAAAAALGVGVVHHHHHQSSMRLQVDSKHKISYTRNYNIPFILKHQHQHPTTFTIYNYNYNYKPQHQHHPKITATSDSNTNTIPSDGDGDGDGPYTPDSKFYKVEAILRPWRLQKVSSALLKLGIRGVTVSDVRGFGAQGGSAHPERHAGSEFSEDSFISKVKMEIVVTKDQVDPVIELIIQEARTGEIGDGKIFVLPVADVIRVRTGERAEQAERMSGGKFDMSNSKAG